MTSNPSPPSEVSRRETRLYAWGMAGMFGGLFLYYAFTLPLTAPALALFGTLSLALMLGYLGLVPRSLYLPRGKGAPLLWRYPAISAAWAFLLTWLLRGEPSVYFFLAAFDDYVSLALFHGRRAAAGWLVAVLAEMFLTYDLLGGAEMAVARVGADLPLFALVCALGELVTRLWEERESAEALTAELDAAYRQLQDYMVQSEALVVAQERARLAHEIHDTLGHTLTALSVQLELLRQLPPERRAERAQALRLAHKLSADAQSEVWRAVQALRPPPLERLSLLEALRQLSQDFTRRTGREVQWQVHGSPYHLSEGAALTLYRALQEALTNIQRHAPDAARISVNLHYAEEEILLIVENSPTEAASRAAAAAGEGGFGLLGLQERAARLEGHLQAGPTPEGGFRLQMSLPLNRLRE